MGIRGEKFCGKDFFGRRREFFPSENHIGKFTLSLDVEGRNGFFGEVDIQGEFIEVRTAVFDLRQLLPSGCARGVQSDKNPTMA